MQLVYGTYTVDSDALSADIIGRIMTMGFSAIVQNSVAGMKKAMLADGKSAEEIEATLSATKSDTVAALLNGTYASRSRGPAGPRESSFDKELFAIAKAWLAAKAKAKGKTLPKTKDGIKELIARGQEKQPAIYAEWVAEATRRVAANAALSEDVGDDLFDDGDEAAEESEAA